MSADGGHAPPRDARTATEPPAPGSAAELLRELLAAFAHADPARAAAHAWPLLGFRAVGQLGDEASLARHLANDRHRPLLAARGYARVSWDERERAARAELLVTPRDDTPPHLWLVTLSRAADGRWLVSGLQREGFEV